MRKEKTLFEKNEQIAKAARIRQKASFDADLEFLSHQKELEACVAETNILELKSDHASVRVELDLSDEDPMIRVENFVNRQSQSLQQQEAIKTEHHDRSEPLTERQECQDTVVKQEIQEPIENIKTDKPPSYADDLVKFLLRKDLTLSRLYTFNDKPENYQTWKSSFSEVMKEMSVSQSEEMDLLVKWLGGSGSGSG